MGNALILLGCFELFDGDQLWLLLLFLHFLWKLETENAVLEGCFNVFLGDVLAHIETSVAGAGVALLVDTFAPGFLLFFGLVLVGRNGKIAVL